MRASDRDRTSAIGAAFSWHSAFYCALLAGISGVFPNNVQYLHCPRSHYNSRSRNNPDGRSLWRHSELLISSLMKKFFEENVGR